MIRKLRLKFTALVLTVLLVITAGIVVSINYFNWTSLRTQAENSLALLMKTGGQRPGALVRHDASSPPEQDGAGPDGAGLDGDGQTVPEGRQLPEGQPDELLPRSADADIVNLSNSYTIHLAADGSVESWTSDRADLYADGQIEALAAQVHAAGTPSGRVGSQFYQTAQQADGTLVVVLDARLEMDSARRLLLSSSLAGLVAYLLMSAGAVLLIRRMTRPVQEAFDKQKQFVMDASHELKTPLSVISANAEALSGEIGPNQWLDYIQSEVRRTDRLVQNLLTMARMDRGAVQARRQPFDLSRALLSVALPFESAVFEAGKQLELDVPDGIQYNGDEEMLCQLAVILLSNALKYSDPGGTITLTLRARGERRVLTVRNTGEGIPKADLPRVFDRFYRVDRSRSRETEGNGLGLAIAKAITEAHRGKITADSQEGQWACFTVTL